MVEHKAANETTISAGFWRTSRRVFVRVCLCDWIFCLFYFSFRFDDAFCSCFDCMRRSQIYTQLVYVHREHQHVECAYYVINIKIGSSRISPHTSSIDEILLLLSLLLQLLFVCFCHPFPFFFHITLHTLHTYIRTERERKRDIFIIIITVCWASY